jgi:hypothetical protein
MMLFVKRKWRDLNPPWRGCGLLLQGKATKACHGTPAVPDVQLIRQTTLPYQLNGWVAQP